LGLEETVAVRRGADLRGAARIVEVDESGFII
jgi:hypothetical protein